MPDDSTNTSAANLSLADKLGTLYQKYRPSPLTIIAIGVAGIITRGCYINLKLDTTMELALRQHGDRNGDGSVSRAERDEFQTDFAKRSGLSYVSGFPFRYPDGRGVPNEDLIKMLEDYTGRLNAH